MHKCWLDEASPLGVGHTVTLSAEESAHVARVLRMKAGDAVELIAAEHLYTGELLLADEKTTTVRVTHELPSPECPVHITLVQGLPKLDKLEMIVQKATELGVWEVLPVEMERSVARLDAKDDKKHERLNRIALEAAKQCGRSHVPMVHSATRFGKALTTLQADHYSAILIAWESESNLRLSDALAALLAHTPSPRAIALVIGPEGGITETEIEQLQAIGGKCVTLGKRILRTETAGLCALAVTLSALGE